MEVNVSCFGSLQPPAPKAEAKKSPPESIEQGAV